MQPVADVVVIAKRPLPGRVKTRLVPPLTHEQAALLAAAALRDTLEVVAQVPCARRTLLFDGDVTGWLPAGWQHRPQVAGGLDRRLAAGLASLGARPSVLVGMDTPQLRVDHFTAWDPSRFDACLGRAADGGFWALGLADPARWATPALLGVAMSRDDTGEQQLRRLTGLGLSVQVLDTLVDVDDVDSARSVADQAPWTSFAGALADVREAAA